MFEGVGHRVLETSQRGRVDHTLDQLRAHYSKLGSTPNVVLDEILVAIRIKRPPNLTLAEQPTEDEVKRDVARMKDSAPGADEVTTSMLKILVSTEERLVALSETIWTMWNMQPQMWSQFLHQAVIIPPWKKENALIWTTIVESV